MLLEMGCDEKEQEKAEASNVVFALTPLVRQLMSGRACSRYI
jgi:hypothetical protein